MPGALLGSWLGVEGFGCEFFRGFQYPNSGPEVLRTSSQACPSTHLAERFGLGRASSAVLVLVMEPDCRLCSSDVGFPSVHEKPLQVHRLKRTQEAPQELSTFQRQVTSPHISESARKVSCAKPLHRRPFRGGPSHKSATKRHSPPVFLKNALFPKNR